MNLRTVLYLLLIVAAFCVAGAIDLAEQERTSVQAYIAERVR